MCITWFLYGNEDVASSRYHGYRVHRQLLSAGKNSRLGLAPATPVYDLPWSQGRLGSIAESVPPGIAVFQKLRGPRTKRLINLLRKKSIRTVYIDCDLEPGNEISLECEVAVAPSEGMVDHLRLIGHEKTYQIKDPVEYWRKPHLHNSAVLRLCWVGNSTNWGTLENVRRAVDILGDSYELVTVSSHPEATHKWSLDGLPRILQQCDVGVVPWQDSAEARVKSDNRAVLFMAAGLPVIAGSAPAYSRLLQDGGDMVLADSVEDWVAALLKMRDTSFRSIVAYNGYTHAIAKRNDIAVLSDWVKLFELFFPHEWANSHKHDFGREVERWGCATVVRQCAGLLRRNKFKESRQCLAHYRRNYSFAYLPSAIRFNLTSTKDRS